MKNWELKAMRKLNIVYDNTGKFHALPYGKAKDTGMTELQMAQALLGYSMYKTKKIVREYLDILDKNCKYNS